MERPSGQGHDRGESSATQQTGCPMCGTALERQSGIDICNGCNWVQQHPAD